MARWHSAGLRCLRPCCPPPAPQRGRKGGWGQCVRSGKAQPRGLGAQGAQGEAAMGPLQPARGHTPQKASCHYAAQPWRKQEGLKTRDPATGSLESSQEWTHILSSREAAPQPPPPCAGRAPGGRLAGGSRLQDGALASHRLIGSPWGCENRTQETCRPRGQDHTQLRTPTRWRPS